MIDVSVAGVMRLTLEVDPLGSTNSDHADWADAHLTFASQAMFNQFIAFQGAGFGGNTEPPAPAITIGTVSITGGGQFDVGDTVTLTASRSGNAGDIAWTWAVPAGSAVASSGTNVLTFTAAESDQGVFAATATSATATDSPQLGQASVTIEDAGDPQPLSIPGWNITAADIGLIGAGVYR